MLIPKFLTVLVLIGLLHVHAGFFEDLADVLGEVNGNDLRSAKPSRSAKNTQPRSRHQPGGGRKSRQSDSDDDDGDDDGPEMNLNDMIDILGAANDVANSINDNSGCHFRCGRGLRPEPKPGHVPEVNGCGAEGLHAKGRFDFEEICNNHDRCYHTCLTKRADCDRTFEQEMMTFCKQNVQDAKDRKACESQASTFSLFAEIGGCHTFLESQEDACDCIATGKKPFRRHDDL